MIRGVPPYSAFGLLECKVVPYVKLVGSDDWLSKKDLSGKGDLIWGEFQWDLSGVEGLERLKVEFEIRTDSTIYRNAYSEAKLEDDVGFGIRLWNKASRRRVLHTGKLKHRRQKGKTPGLITATAEVDLPMIEFAGEIELQPIIYLKAITAFDRITYQSVQKGGILGWSLPTVILLERSRKGLSTMFEFRWVRFSEHPELPVDSDELYHLQWEVRPVIYLNQDVDFFETVLMSDTKVGRAARLRNNLEIMIAHQVLTSCLSVALGELFRLHSENPSASPDDLLVSLPTHDQLIFKEWCRALDPVGGSDRGETDIIEALLEAGEQQALGILAGELPRRLQHQLTTKSVTERLLEEVMKEAAARND